MSKIISTKRNMSVVNTGGLSYNEISEIMTKSGDKMNHNNVRAIMVKSFMKIADHINKHYDRHYSDTKLLHTAINANFQETVVGLIEEEITHRINRKKEKKEKHDS
jgi:hypothetical protein